MHYEVAWRKDHQAIETHRSHLTSPHDNNRIPVRKTLIDSFLFNDLDVIFHPLRSSLFILCRRNSFTLRQFQPAQSSDGMPPTGSSPLSKTYFSIAINHFRNSPVAGRRALCESSSGDEKSHFHVHRQTASKPTTAVRLPEPPSARPTPVFAKRSHFAARTEYLPDPSPQPRLQNEANCD
jgi:hypothetical protein